MIHTEVTPVSRVVALVIIQGTVPRKGDAPLLHLLVMSVAALAICHESAPILSKDDGERSSRQEDTGDGVVPAAPTA